MKAVPATYLAWSILTVMIGLIVVVMLVGHVFVPSISQEPFLVDLAIIVALVAIGTTGVFVSSRNPSNPIGWLLLLGPVAGILAESAFMYAQYTIHVRPGVLPGGELMGLVSLPLWLVFFAQVPFLMLLFPGGPCYQPAGAGSPGDLLVLSRWPWSHRYWCLKWMFTLLSATPSPLLAPK